MEAGRTKIIKFRIFNFNYLVKNLFRIFFNPSPERTPPNVALAEVLVAGRLGDEPLHLLRHLEALLNTNIITEISIQDSTHLCVKLFPRQFISMYPNLCVKIFPRKFVSDPLHDIQRELVEDLRFN